MAERLSFYVRNSKVYSRKIEFEWMPGLSVSQKQKSVANMHEQINGSALEVSTKSKEELGKKLSAFNLRLNGKTLENIFQSSKCFTHDGPFVDLLEVSPKEAKSDVRLKTSGELKYFLFEGKIWKLEPKTAFYDYIYIRAVKESLSKEEISRIRDYEYFTDIEFNHKKSINTQARTVALIKVLLEIFGEIPDIESQEEFLQFHKSVVKD